MSGGLPSSLRDALGTLVLCRRCRGRGVIDVRRTFAPRPGRPPVHVIGEMTCSICHGDGIVPAPRGGGPL